MKDEIKCPLCGYELKFEINSQKGPTVEFYLPENKTKYNILLKNFYWYLLDKETKYKTPPGFKTPEYEFKYNAKKDTFTFAMSIYYNGYDQWWTGEFKLGLGRRIEIIKEEMRNEGSGILI